MENKCKKCAAGENFSNLRTKMALQRLVLRASGGGFSPLSPSPGYVPAWGCLNVSSERRQHNNPSPKINISLMTNSSR